MPDDDDIALSEKRLYGDRREETRLYVASAMGVAYVAASDDQIGRFGLEHQCVARDIAGRDGQLVVATEEDVLVGTGDDFATTGFGPAVAVGLGDGIIAAGPDGRVARRAGTEWETVGDLADVRAIDGAFVAARDGIYDYEGDLAHLGLDDARDVAVDGPYAATATGVFRRADGWNREVEGDATVVASAGERAHAVVDGDLLVRREDGAWEDAGAPVDGVVDVAYDEATFVVTADGEVALDPVAAKDGTPEWRSRSLGVQDVVGVAIP